MPQKLIVLDGGEGVGKTTLIRSLKETYPAFVFTREPGGTPFAEAVRAVLLSDAGAAAGDAARLGLFWGARADHVEKLVRPALATTSVVCDRFDSSSFAYQIQNRMHPLFRLFWETRDAYLCGIEPHYILLDIDPTVAQERVRARGAVLTHYDAMHIEEHRKIRAGFLRFAQCLSEGWGAGEAHVVDAAPPAEEVFKAVHSIIESVCQGS